MGSVIHLFDAAPAYMHKHQREALYQYRVERAKAANPHIEELRRIARLHRSVAVFQAAHRELARTMAAMFPGWNAAGRQH